MDDEVAAKFAEINWRYAEQDLSGLESIRQRIAATGRDRGLLTYSESVVGIEFQMQTVEQGRPFKLGIPGWTDLHRAIIGDLLVRLTGIRWLRSCPG